MKLMEYVAAVEAERKQQGIRGWFEQRPEVAGEVVGAIRSGAPASLAHRWLRDEHGFTYRESSLRDYVREVIR